MSTSLKNVAQSDHLWCKVRNLLQVPDNAEVIPVATYEWRLPITIGGIEYQREFTRVWHGQRSISVLYVPETNCVYVRRLPVRRG